MKKYLLLLSAAVVIGALTVKSERIELITKCGNNGGSGAQPPEAET